VPASTAETLRGAEALNRSPPPNLACRSSGRAAPEPAGPPTPGGRSSRRDRIQRNRHAAAGQRHSCRATISFCLDFRGQGEIADSCARSRRFPRRRHVRSWRAVRSTTIRWTHLEIRREARRRVRRRYPDRVAGIARRATSKSCDTLMSPSRTSSETSTPSRLRAAVICCRNELTIQYGMLPRANPRHLRPERAARSRGQGPGGIVQHHAGRRCPVKGYPVAFRSTCSLLHGEPRGLHRARQDHHAPQGSPGSEIVTPLSGVGRSGDGHHRAGSVDGSLRAARSHSGLHRGSSSSASRSKRAPTNALDRRSGVSQRMPISVLENVVSTAERRAVSTGEREVVPRIADVYAAGARYYGKPELEYEGELVGATSSPGADPARLGCHGSRCAPAGVNTDDVVMVV